MNKKLLPVEYPIVSSNSEHGYLLSSIQTNKSAWEWIISNYVHISLYFAPNGYDINFVPMANHANCPCINYQRISNELIKRKWNNIIDFVIESIESGKYVFIHLDWYWLPCSDSFRKKHVWHPTLIYGFDKYHKTLNLADFYTNGKFIFTTEKVENICKAFNSGIEHEVSYFNKRYNCADSVILYDHILNFKYKFYLELLIDSLCDFLKSTNISMVYDRGDQVYYEGKYKNYSTVFGINVLTMIAQLFNDEIDRKINLKLLSVPLEHTNLMLRRIEYLETHNYLVDSSMIKCIFKDIQKKMHIAVGLSCKYNIVLDRKILKRLSMLFMEIKELEQQGCEKLISHLQDYAN